MKGRGTQVEWRNHHGSFAGKSTDAFTSGGNHMHRTRRTNPWSGQGQLPRIAYSLSDVCRLVPGSPAAAYVGAQRLILKARGEAFERVGEAFERIGGRSLAWAVVAARLAAAQLVQLVAQQQRGEQQRARLG